MEAASIQSQCMVVRGSVHLLTLQTPSSEMCAGSCRSCQP